MYVIQHKPTKLYSRNQGKHASSGPEYHPSSWTDNVEKACVFKTTRCEKAWWFGEDYEMVKLKLGV